MTRIKKVSYFLQLILTSFIILISAGYLILIANGYKINFQAKKIQKTGMIYVKSDPKDVQIFLNNELVKDKTPARLNDLLPKRYDIKVQKENYYPWSKTITVSSGLVSIEENIVLYLINPLAVSPTLDEINSFNNLSDQLVNNDLEIIGSDEIWIKTKNNEKELITRLSQPIKKIAFANDRYHILYQIGSEIHLICRDGSNDIKLIQLNSDLTSKFITVDDGQNLLYLDGTEVKKVTIR